VRLNPDLPEDLERIISKLLEKDRELGYQSAGELLADLRRVGARAELSGAPTRRRARLRIRLAVAATVGAGAMLALAVAWSFGGLRERLSGGPNVPRIESLAVMPLENRSGDPGQEYFVDGMTEALIAELYRIPELKKVISPISVMLYKNTRKPTAQIARELNVDGLVQGSALREGDTVRVTVHLIHGATDQELWADKFDREYRNILSLYSDVARAIAEGIRLKLSPAGQARRRVVDPEAYQLYLRGQYHWNKFTADDLLKGIAWRSGHRQDPTFALAYSGLANCYRAWCQLPASERTFPKAKAAALRRWNSTARWPTSRLMPREDPLRLDWTGARISWTVPWRSAGLRGPPYEGLPFGTDGPPGRGDDGDPAGPGARPARVVINLDVGSDTTSRGSATGRSSSVKGCLKSTRIRRWFPTSSGSSTNSAVTTARRSPSCETTPADGRSDTGAAGKVMTRDATWRPAGGAAEPAGLARSTHRLGGRYRRRGDVAGRNGPGV
jgi:TolB-like protein